VSSSLPRRQATADPPPSHLHQPRRWSPLSSLAAPAKGGRRDLFPLFVGRFRACLLWCVNGMVGAAPGQINMHQLHYHTGGNLHGYVSELMTTCACRSLRSIGWYSRCSSNLMRSVSRCVAIAYRYPWQRWGPEQGGCSRPKMLYQRWWICHLSSTLLMGCGVSWYKIAR
jgi:hypothetical protein